VRVADAQPMNEHAIGATRPRAPSTDAVWAWLSVLVPAIVGLLLRVSTIDLAYHVRAGEMILRSRSIPRVDTFTFTVAGRPWVDQQWGAQTLIALAHRVDGFAGVVTLRAVLLGLAFGLLYRVCRARGAPPLAASILCIGGFVVGSQTLSMRPQLFALALGAGVLLLLELRHRRALALWGIPILGALWANLHGSFVLLPAFIGLAFLEEVHARDRASMARLATVGAATVGATFLNPFGPSVWRYAVELAADPVIREQVSEWAPIATDSFAGVAFFVSAAAMAGWLAVRGRPTPWPDLAWLGCFFFMTLPAGRGVIWWALVAPRVVAGLVPSKGSGELRRPGGLLDAAVLVALAAGTLAALPIDRPEPSLLWHAPQDQVDAAERLLPPGSRLLVPQPWGSWFELALPADPVFVDARIELFPDEVWEGYLRVQDGAPGWAEVLDRWSVDGVVVEVSNSALKEAIGSDPAWRSAYADDDGTLYVRR
jgi:hypothetical protein